MIRFLLCLLLAAGALAQVNSLLEQADAAFRAGNFDQAVALARRVTPEDPRVEHAHMILGVIAVRRNQWEDATGHFEAVIRLAPSSPYGYFYLGQASLYQHNWEKAARCFTSALERNYPDRTRLIIDLASAQNEAGRAKEALSSLRQIQPPTEGELAAQYHAVLAFSKAKLNQPAEAIQEIRAARQLDAFDPRYWEFLVLRLIGTNQMRLALSEVIEAQKRFPDDPGIQFLLGFSGYLARQGDLMELGLRNLREVQPADPRVLILTGVVYRYHGESDKAMLAFTQAAERGVPDAHFLLGLIRKDAGDLAGAEREFRQAERDNPEQAQVILELGKLLLARGEAREALTRLQKAELYMPRTAAVHYQLGIAYTRLGDKQSGGRHFAMFRTLAKENPESSDAIPGTPSPH